MTTGHSTAVSGSDRDTRKTAAGVGAGGYAQLSGQVRQAGLLRRRHAHYAVRVSLTVGCYLLGWVLFWWIGDTWWQLAIAALMGVLFTQVAFLGHDIGHKQVVAGRRAADTAGMLLGDLALGLSYGWWNDKHNRHHAHPNEEGRDPDVKGNAIAFSQAQAERRSGRAGRMLARSQAWLFFPMLALEGLHLHVASIRFLSSTRSRNRSAELALQLVHIAAYCALLFTVLSPLTAVAFAVVNQAVFGLYLGISFAPNHKGMTMLEADSELDYLDRQVLTSRNIKGNWFTDLLLGGLNYQIEHHLFPTMPRPGLRHAQPLVREHCARAGLPYVETGLWRSYAIVLRHLHEVGQHARATSAGAVAD